MKDDFLALRLETFPLQYHSKTLCTIINFQLSKSLLKPEILISKTMSIPHYLNKLLKSRVLVFGGTSGIGFGVASAAIEYGATTILSSSSETKIESTIQKFKASYQNAQVLGFVCDLSNSDSLEANLISILNYATNDGKDKPNHIVFTAGDALPLKPLSEITPEYIKDAGNVRFIAPLILTKLIPSYVHASPDSSFTITSGIIGTKPAPGWSIVAAYSMASEGLTRGLAVDLSPVRVNCVSPGSVKTELLGGMPEEALEGMRQRTLTKRMGRVEDIAEVYMYLMKDGFVTGSVVHSNGGGLLA